jgi:hypothetical protein
MSTVKEESKKLDLNYAVTRALDGITSEAKKVQIINEQSEEHLRSFENRLNDAQVGITSFYICAIYSTEPTERYNRPNHAKG